MIRLTNQTNIAHVLAELKEYAKEVDVDFVRKAVRAIGRCAIKVEASAERCVATLVELVNTKVNYVVQEAIVVIKVINLAMFWLFTVLLRIFSESIPTSTRVSSPISARI